MPKQSAGILLYRIHEGILEVLLVHPGGPLHKNKDLGDWSIPKGEFAEDENSFEAAKREFEEELGHTVPSEEFIELKPIKQKSGKIVQAWAALGDMDASIVSSNTFPLEWPPRSGKWLDVPEVDRAEWFTLPIAVQKINPAQVALLEELEERLSDD